MGGDANNRLAEFSRLKVAKFYSLPWGKSRGYWMLVSLQASL